MKRNAFNIVADLMVKVFVLRYLFSFIFSASIIIAIPYGFQVNGDTLFMTGNFKEFKVENQSNENWDENNAVTSTAVCIALIHNIHCL